MNCRLAGAADLIFFHISAVQPDQPAVAEGAPKSAEGTAEAAQPEGGAQIGAGQQGIAAQQGDETQGSKEQGEKGKKRDLSELLQPGDAVEFVVAASSQEGVRQHKGSRPPKLMGKEVSTAFSTPALHRAKIPQALTLRGLGTSISRPPGFFGRCDSTPMLAVESSYTFMWQLEQ